MNLLACAVLWCCREEVFAQSTAAVQGSAAAEDGRQAFTFADEVRGTEVA